MPHKTHSTQLKHAVLSPRLVIQEKTYDQVKPSSGRLLSALKEKFTRFYSHTQNVPFSALQELQSVFIYFYSFLRLATSLEMKCIHLE